ncbi:MAG: hypothetical protein AAF639_32020 [Chloroflexota bacterium]
MSNQKIQTILWWLCLFIAPSILVIIELFHPAGFTKEPPGMYQYLSHSHSAPYAHGHKALGYFGPEWWFILHMIQTPAVGLVAIGLWLMLANVGDEDGGLVLLTSWLSRIATYIFLIYYTVLDSIGGIGLGQTILVAERLHKEGGKHGLNETQMQGVERLLNATWVDPWIGGVNSFVSQTGSWAIFFAALFAAITLFLAKKAPLPALILLIAFGWFLQLTHASYYGPLAFTLLIAASIWIWAYQHRASAQEG